jgi:tetraacyldisaccharide 4'-kinase
MLPTGNLRESRRCKRAILLTKCPANLSATDRNSIKNRLEIAGNQKLYFTNIEFDEFIYSEKQLEK